LFAGLQYATNFGTQPGFITYPLNSLSGQTALPSVVNVYVNNVLTATARVPQGPFTLNNLPSINGRGEIRLMVRDLLGREQAIVQSLYGSTLLLRPGLNDFSFQAGTLRENYGITSNDYGRGFASGVWRRGVTAELTTETGMESARGRRAVGLGTTWLAGGYGEFSASFAHSVQAATTVERAQLPVTPTTNSESPSLSPVVSRSGRGCVKTP
jgi:outer membrane usher protein